LAALSLPPGPAGALPGSDLDAETALSLYRAVVTRYHADALDFELSVGYIHQATRHGFGAFVAPDNVTLVTRDPVSDRPVIVASVGKDRAERIANVARELHHRFRRPVVVKNVGPVLEEELRGRGLRDYVDGEHWRPWAPRDDNTFPEQILENRALARLVGTRYRKLRHERNQLLRRYRLEISPRSPARPGRDGPDRLLAAWATRLGRRTGLWPEDLVETVRGLLAPRPGLLHYEARDHDTGALVALFVLSPISRACLAFNALVNDPGHPSSFRVFVLAAASLAAGLGYDFLNVQGSEDRTQHLSKRKLRPVTELPKTHLVFAR
jgi:hypothetical protein